MVGVHNAPTHKGDELSEKVYGIGRIQKGGKKKM